MFGRAAAGLVELHSVFCSVLLAGFDVASLGDGLAESDWTFALPLSAGDEDGLDPFESASFESLCARSFCDFASCSFISGGSCSGCLQPGNKNKTAAIKLATKRRSFSSSGVNILPLR